MMTISLGNMMRYPASQKKLQALSLSNGPQVLGPSNGLKVLRSSNGLETCARGTSLALQAAHRFMYSAVKKNGEVYKNIPVTRVKDADPVHVEGLPVVRRKQHICQNYRATDLFQVHLNGHF